MNSPREPTVYHVCRPRPRNQLFTKHSPGAFFCELVPFGGPSHSKWGRFRRPRAALGRRPSQNRPHMQQITGGVHAAGLYLSVRGQWPVWGLFDPPRPAPPPARARGATPTPDIRSSRRLATPAHERQPTLKTRVGTCGRPFGPTSGAASPQISATRRGPPAVQQLFAEIKAAAVLAVMARARIAPLERREGGNGVQRHIFGP